MQPTLKDFCAQLKAAGHACTLLGVGPVSATIVRATFEACKAHACPPIFIASRNQVDLAALGHGYLMGGMDQRAFVGLLERVRADIGYEGPLYICRDHGGPWQRDAELRDQLPVARALAIARDSFAADIEAGFNYLHIDPTKCPLPFTPDDLCAWTVELEAHCETVRKKRGHGPIDYEVGTEDIQGGLTTREAFEAFLGRLIRRLDDLGLPRPTCVVGQTGTLTRMDHNVGRFDREGTQALAATAARLGVGFKEHNGDYLSAATCRVHPDLGVTGMNVAPEFGLVETEALLALADLEQKLVREGWLAESDSSTLRALLAERTFAHSPWKKWMSADIKARPEADLARDRTVRDLIARVCGHYVYDEAEVMAARARLFANIDRANLVEEGAERFVVRRVRDAIEFYLVHFRLTGINRRGESGPPPTAAPSPPSPAPTAKRPAPRATKRRHAGR